MGDWYPADEYAIPEPLEVQDVLVRREWDNKAGKYKDIVEKGVSRRYSDSRIWNALDQRQQEAAKWILSAHELKEIRQRGARTARYSDVPGGGQHDPERYEERYELIVGAYDAWCDLCKKYRADRQMAVNVFTEGWNMRHVDRYRRQRSGTGMKNLKEALDLLCDAMAAQKKKMRK